MPPKKRKAPAKTAGSAGAKKAKKEPASANPDVKKALLAASKRESKNKAKPDKFFPFASTSEVRLSISVTSKCSLDYGCVVRFEVTEMILLICTSVINDGNFQSLCLVEKSESVNKSTRIDMTNASPVGLKLSSQIMDMQSHFFGKKL